MKFSFSSVWPPKPKFSSLREPSVSNDLNGGLNEYCSLMAADTLAARHASASAAAASR